MKSIYGTLMLVLALSLTACAKNITAHHYETGQTQQVSQVLTGVIISAAPVQVSGSGWIGTLAGGVAGATLGMGYGADAAAAVGGALLGGFIGNKIEAKLSSQTATRYMIRLDNGEVLAVVQKDEKPLPVGSKVNVIKGQPAQVISVGQ